MRVIHILSIPRYKVGDPEPDGYLQWHEWAKKHHEAGLEQTLCCHCNRFKYPHQLSPRIIQTKLTLVVRRGRSKRVIERSRICQKCDDAITLKKAEGPQCATPVDQKNP